MANDQYNVDTVMDDSPLSDVELKKYVVLLVDDDKNILSGLTRALHKQPYSLITARSADEAIYIMKSHSVHVMVVDHKMPGMSGTEFLEWTAHHFPETKRIMMTGHPDTDCFMKAVNSALIYRFYSKPVPIVELAISIRTAIEEIESGIDRAAMPSHPK